MRILRRRLSKRGEEAGYFYFAHIAFRLRSPVCFHLSLCFHSYLVNDSNTRLGSCPGPVTRLQCQEWKFKTSGSSTSPKSRFFTNMEHRMYCKALVATDCSSESRSWPFQMYINNYRCAGHAKVHIHHIRSRCLPCRNKFALYMIPVAVSTLIYIWFCDGRRDWKYPRQRTIPPPMSLVSRSVKNDRTLNGHRFVGSMRTTTFKAWHNR